jgi:tripartite-type tricarboxylate transporter receptor subunit TctC
MRRAAAYALHMKNLPSNLPAYAFALALTAAALTSTAARAQPAADYPSKPITIIFPWSPGSADSVLRELAEQLTLKFKQPVIIDSKPGASTIIGANLVARAPADGYTLLYGSTTTFVINPSTFDHLPYDPVKDFVPISGVITAPFFVFTRPGLPVKNMADFIALAKAHPGTLSYATPGIGSVPHLSIERLSQQTGIKMIHVPYKGSSAMLTDVAGDHVDFAFYTSAYSFVKEGKVHGLAVSGPDRLTAAPELPTMAEAGVPNYAAAVWFGLAAPAGTPKAIVDKLSAAIDEALADKKMKARYAEEGIVLTPSTPEAFASQIKAEIPIWRNVVKTAGVHVDTGAGN